jgi:hypothetical protein
MKFDPILKAPTKEGLTVYGMVGTLQTEAFKDKRLKRNAQGLYEAVTYAGKTRKYDYFDAKFATGLYDFVVTTKNPDVCWIRREKSDRARKYASDPNRKVGDRGHSAIAQGGDVLFAGSLMFGGGVTTGDKPAGELLWWENKSGHYFCGKQIADDARRKHIEQQTKYLTCPDGSRLLPMDKLQLWDNTI